MPASTRRPRSAAEDAILRPHEDDPNAHKGLVSTIVEQVLAEIEAGGGVGGGGGLTLGTGTPAAILPGTGAAGTGSTAAPWNHQHPLDPSAAGLATAYEVAALITAESAAREAGDSMRATREEAFVYALVL